MGAERQAPYHRPPLSKKLLTGKVHRAGSTLRRNSISMHGYCEARRRTSWTCPRALVIFATKTGTCHEQFDGLVIASGAAPREWPGGPVPDGVLMLRTVEDCLTIRERLSSRPRVVVVGGGFIGAEVAASCRSMGLDVVVIEKAASPLLAALARSWLHAGPNCTASTA